ncbi:dipeptidase [Silvibacterium dinghuense]|uniref:Peptidase M19 n=1 Tax=Silvibacterium dinghuense TaxID=1560006 RepID=A0A4Q1SI61_9BACT|nr:membrane dipeptidase [Silvibacterium dinghuense]RXS97301.1 peptidase M19 [Silvibacterium dinghuense]GGG97908.1 putative dipeptidase [Silvibacterium dinghuense]
MTARSGRSRRQFLSTVAMTAGAAMTLGQRWAWAADAAGEGVDPRVSRTVAKTLGIDTHNHIDVPMTADEVPGPDIDLSGEMKRSGLTAICMTFATDYQQGNAYERFKNAMASMDRQLERNGMKRSLTPDDVHAAHRKHQPTVIQSVEGAHFLEGHLDRVEEAYHRGLRHFGLLHDSDATPPLGDVYTRPPQYGGLTPFGVDVVRECNRLGMLIDLAHADMKTTQDALKISTKPMVISHTGPDWRLGNDPRMAQMMRPRLISKEQAKAVASAGGAVGVWTHLADTPLDYAKNLHALADVIGVDHVCIGTDTKLTPPTPWHGGPPPGTPHPDGPHAGGPPGGPSQVGQRTNLAWADQKTGFYYAVVDAMLKVGFATDEIGKIGSGNYLRIFSAVVGE